MDFKEPGGSLLPLHEPAIGPYLQQELSNLPDHNSPLKSILILSSHLRLGLKVSFLQVSPLKLCMHFWIAPYVLYALPISVSRPRWPSGYHTRLWIRGSRVRSRPGSMDFFQSVEILVMTSFEREVKPWVPCRRFTARKRTSSRN